MAQYNDHITADAAPIQLSILCSILPSIVKKSPRYLNSFTCGSKLTPNPKGAVHCFPAQIFVWLSFRFCCKLPQCVLKIIVWWRQPNHIIHKEHRSNAEVPKPNSPLPGCTLRSYLNLKTQQFLIWDLSMPGQQFWQVKIQLGRYKQAAP